MQAQRKHVYIKGADHIKLIYIYSDKQSITAYAPTEIISYPSIKI